MKFNYSHKIGETFVTVNFHETIKINAFIDLILCFEKLGGVYQESISTWRFPVYITSQVIQEIISNSCFKCGGVMKDSTAMQNTLVSFDDFGNDAGSRGTTQTLSGHPNLIKVRKCTVCGHSHT